MVSRQRLREALKAAGSRTAALLGLVLAACARLLTDPPPPTALPERAQIEARAHTVLETALLLKPRESDVADALAAGLAPLLFFETEAHETDADRRAPQKIFYRAGALVVSGRAFPQMSYLWRAGNGSNAPLRGVRITLDSRGLPVIWEVLNGAGSAGSGALRVVFVAQSLEARAQAAFGGPLPGRRFAVEADGGWPQGSVVARVLEDGPALMGPEVYVNRAGEILAVACRCMPPQVRRLSSTGWYGLEPLAADDAAAARWLAGFPETAIGLCLPPDF